MVAAILRKLEFFVNKRRTYEAIFTILLIV